MCVRCLSSRVWSPAGESDLHQGNDQNRTGNQRWQPSRGGYNSQGEKTRLGSRVCLHAFLVCAPTSTPRDGLSESQWPGVGERQGKQCDEVVFVQRTKINGDTSDVAREPCSLSNPAPKK